MFAPVRDREERSPRDLRGIVDLDEQCARTLTKNASQIDSALLAERGTRWILRSRRHYDHRNTGTQRALERLGQWSFIVDREGSRNQTERSEQIEQGRKRRVLDRDVIAGSRMFAQQAFDRIEAPARDGNRTVADAVDRELACCECHQR
jgi:hypothetical protein